MSNDSPWLTVLIVLLLVLGLVGMIAYARGPKHHRGDDRGSQATKIIVVQPSG